MRSFRNPIAVLLAFLMLFSLAATAFAVDENETERDTSIGGHTEPTDRCIGGAEHAWVSYTVPRCVTNAGLFGDSDTGVIQTGTFSRCSVCGKLISEETTADPADHSQDPFTDIASSGFHDYIIAASFLGLATGFNDGTFQPKTNVTRAQFITMLWRLDGEKSPVDPTLGFADQSDIAQPFRAAVAWGVENGIIKGYNDNTFAPRKDISRAQMATFLYRYFCMLEGNESASAELTAPVDYADAAMIASAYKDAVSFISNIGIMNGTGNNMFSPNGTANRGMAATVLVRTALLLEDDQ